MSDIDLGFAPPTPPEIEGDLTEPRDDRLGDVELDTPAELGPVPVITEQQLHDFLDGAGRALSIGSLNLGVPNELTPSGRGLWRFTDDELEGLVPPLCRVVNRRPPLARAVAKGDEVFVVLQLAGYFGRRGDVVLEARRTRTEGNGGNDQQQGARDAAREDAGVGSVFGGPAGNGASGGGDVAAGARAQDR